MIIVIEFNVDKKERRGTRFDRNDMIEKKKRDVKRRIVKLLPCNVEIDYARFIYMKNCAQ